MAEIEGKIAAHEAATRMCTTNIIGTSTRGTIQPASPTRMPIDKH